jgi:hypothetical protein
VGHHTREKDLDFVHTAIRHGLVHKTVLLERTETLPVLDETRRVIIGQIEADFARNLQPEKISTK